MKLQGELETVDSDANSPQAGGGTLVCTGVEVLKQWSEEHERPMEPIPPSRQIVAGEAPKGPCKFWVNTGRCSREPCPYSHDEVLRHTNDVIIVSSNMPMYS